MNKKDDKKDRDDSVSAFTSLLTGTVYCLPLMFLVQSQSNQSFWLIAGFYWWLISDMYYQNRQYKKRERTNE